MNHELLVAEFLATPWALMPERLSAVSSVLARWSVGVSPSDQKKDRIKADRAVRDVRRQASTAQSTGGIAVLPLYGVITQRGNMVQDVSGPGSTSTQQFGSALRQLLADDTVGQILIDIDSPGGSVYGVAELADEIQSARAQKPVVAIANSLAASAAYWIGCAASEFYVTVQMTCGTLGSVSYAAFLGNAQLAIIGDEIVSFRSAILNIDGTYTVRGFLRGRRGSEYVMGAHAIGDRFVLVDTSTIIRVADTSASIGMPRLYRAVSSGLSTATPQTFTNTGAGLKPYAVVQVSGGRYADGSVLINWVRRSRTNGEWRDGVAAAVTATISTCDSVWTAATNVTATADTSVANIKQGSACASLVTAAGFTTGKIAYFPTGTLDLSGYQQVSFWFMSNQNVANGSTLSLRLCSDAAGATTVHTIAIPVQAAGGGYWYPVTVDLGANMSSSIQSVALYADATWASSTVRLDNIIACKASSAADSLTLNSLIAKEHILAWAASTTYTTGKIAPAQRRDAARQVSASVTWRVR